MTNLWKMLVSLFFSACILNCYWHAVHITYLLQTGSKHDVIKVSALSRTAKITIDVFVQKMQLARSNGVERYLSPNTKP